MGKNIKILLFIFTIFIADGCCTKVDCDTTTYPNIILYFPEAANPLHTLSIVALDKNTHQKIDSFSTVCDQNSCPFMPWSNFQHEDWRNYDYALSINEYTGFKDTIYDISCDKVANSIQCNQCFPPSHHGEATAISYTNLTLYSKGMALHDGDSVLMKR